MMIKDIDEFTGLMTGWDSDWRQLEAGQPSNRIELVSGRSTVLQRVRLSHAIHQRGTPPADLVTFGIPKLKGPSTWNGRDSTAPGIFDFNGADGYDCVSGKAFCGLTLSFPRHKLQSISQRLGQDIERTLDGRIWDLNSQESPLLREFHSDLHDLFARTSRILDPAEQSLLRKQLDTQLPERLIFALASHQQGKREQTLKTRQKGLRLAIEFMEEQCHSSPSMPEVCVSVGLSWRSLDRAFKECFGLGPKRYLLNLRLTRARRELKHAPDGVKVVDVANQWGFWHMGDFAREYRLMFGELPAQTLAKNNQDS